MKIKWEEKYTVISVYVCIVLSFAALLTGLLLNFDRAWGFIKGLILVLNPAIYGFVIAFLINPVMVFFENGVFAFVERKKKRHTLKRVLSLISAFLVVIIALSLFASVLFPQIVTSYKDLQYRLEGYVSGAQEWVFEIFDEDNHNFFARMARRFIDVETLTDYVNNFIKDSYTLIIDFTPYVINFFTEIINHLKNALIGIIFSIYFLFSKEKLCAQVKKATYAFFSRRRASRMVRAARLTKRTFEGFVIGKIIDSIIIGILTFIVLMIVKMPYYPLISLIVGVTNVIPFFGPFFGAIPSFFIIFIADPVMSLWFLVIILIIQQIDGNFIGPKILGDTTNLSALWVMFAIILMSGVLGLTGMFIGVPVFAVLYALFAEAANRRLIAKGKSRRTGDYYGNKYGKLGDAKAVSEDSSAKPATDKLTGPEKEEKK